MLNGCFWTLDAEFLLFFSPGYGVRCAHEQILELEERCHQNQQLDRKCQLLWLANSWVPYTQREIQLALRQLFILLRIAKADNKQTTFTEILHLRYKLSFPISPLSALMQSEINNVTKQQIENSSLSLFQEEFVAKQQTLYCILWVLLTFVLEVWQKRVTIGDMNIPDRNAVLDCFGLTATKMILTATSRTTDAP